MENLWDINNVFASACAAVKNITGLELGLGELVELRKESECTLNLHKNYLAKNVDLSQRIDPALEAAFIFLNRNYNMQIYNFDDYRKWMISNYEDKKHLGFDYYLKYFRHVQEERILP